MGTNHTLPQGAVYTIQIDMKQTRALHELVVWNYNSSLEG